MKPDRLRTQENSRTRTAILDATEAIMREEGYAAVSSRRVAERAGLKSQLVHYHFGTMDELFLELYRRTEEDYFSRHLKSLTSSDPIGELWKFSTDTSGIELVLEFVAAANHRKSLRDELARGTERSRSIQNAILTRLLQDSGTDPVQYPPEILSFFISSVSRALVTEANLGVTAGHAAIFEYVEILLQRLRRKPDSGG
jgi:AcrR family transcriptional regulator